MSSQQIPGYKRHSLDEFTPEIKRQRTIRASMSSDGKKTRGRVKINIEFIQDKQKRCTTFSKRKAGLMKKSHELATLTGSQVMVLVASETGHVYTFSTPKFKPILNSQQGRKLIRTCLSDETRNDDEDDINIDEVKVDQLEEINQSDENADYGDNDENDASDYREDEVFKVEQPTTSNQLLIQQQQQQQQRNDDSRPVQMNTIVYQSNQRVVTQRQNPEPEQPQRLVRVTGSSATTQRQIQNNTQYTVSSSIPVVIRGGNQRAVIQPNGMRIHKPEFVRSNYDAGGGGGGSNEDEDYEHDYYEQQNGRRTVTQQRYHTQTQNPPQQRSQVIFSDRTPNRVIQRR